MSSQRARSRRETYRSRLESFRLVREPLETPPRRRPELRTTPAFLRRSALDPDALALGVPDRLFQRVDEELITVSSCGRWSPTRSCDPGIGESLVWRSWPGDRPMVCSVDEEATEDRRAVEAREAQSVDRTVMAHQRSAVPIRKKRRVGYGGRAHVSSWPLDAVDRFLATPTTGWVRRF